MNMMRYALVLVLLLASPGSLVLAEPGPQLRWEGYVRGSAVLYIQGDRVDIQGRQTGSVDSPRVSFNEPLPASRQRVRVNLVRGRGRVAVIEQPEPGNEYTAIVRIDPAGQNQEFHRIYFFWSAAADKTEAGR